MLKPEGYLYQRGQGLNEYGLIGMLIIGLVLPALILLGTNLNTGMQGWSKSLVAKRTVVSSPVASGQKKVVGIASTGQLSLVQPVSKLPMTIEAAQPLVSTVATLGANGASTLAADKMEAIARELKSQNKITDEQYNLLIQLANQGHRLGAIEKLIEDVGATATNINTYEDTRVTFEGRRYTIEELGDMIGYLPPSGSKYSSSGKAYTTLPKDLLNPPYGAQRESKAFLKLYQQVEKSGALSDPAVNQVIRQLTTEIALLSESVDQAKGKAFAAGDIDPGDIQALIVSTVTHANSAQICTTGQGTDSNNHCSQ